MEWEMTVSQTGYLQVKSLPYDCSSCEWQRFSELGLQNKRFSENAIGSERDCPDSCACSGDINGYQLHNIEIDALRTNVVRIEISYSALSAINQILSRHSPNFDNCYPQRNIVLTFYSLVKTIFVKNGVGLPLP